MKREEALKVSETALKELAQALRNGKSEALVRYLDTMSQFHQYSFSNCMLIYSQRPDATFIAGYAKWKKLGRQVKKGEKGIGIIAPMVGKRKDDRLDSQGADQPKTVFGFRVVHVFDLSQTEGDDLPSLDMSVDGDPGEKLERLEQFVRSQQIELAYIEDGLGGAVGVSKGGRIEVLKSLAEGERFSVLVHEVAHELLHRGDRRSDTTKTVRELEAEAVAYAVCRSLGFDTSQRSADYIQLYSGDEKLLLESLEHIRNVASTIITELAQPLHTEVSDAA